MNRTFDSPEDAHSGIEPCAMELLRTSLAGKGRGADAVKLGKPRRR